jgi:hypothetical protein
VCVMQVFERGQDVRLRLQGNHAKDLSSAASPPPDAEAGEHSAAPDFDPPSYSVTCASVGDVSPNCAKTLSLVKLPVLHLVDRPELTKSVWTRRCKLDPKRRWWAKIGSSPFIGDREPS